MLLISLRPNTGMKDFFKRRRFSRELKKLAKEKAERGKPLSVMDNIVFKIMLASDTEESREALRHLISACTHREVTGVQVRNPELYAVHLEGKSPRLDINVTFNDGEIVNLEMQINLTDDDLRDRSVVYTSMLIAGQTKKGDDYRQTKRVYQIFFLNCILFPDSPKMPQRYYYMEEEEHNRLSEISEIIFYEMPKLRRKARGILTEKIDIDTLSNEEKWCIYFRYRHDEKAAELIKKLCAKEEGIMWAERAAAKIDRDYDKYLRKMSDIKYNMEVAARRNYARKEGRAEGLAQGMEKSTLEIARKMKTMGEPVEKIQTITGLPVTTIEKL